MRTTIFALLFLIGVCLAQTTCFQAPANPEDRRTDKSKLVVATYNAEWLFLANEQDPASCPEAGCPYPTLADAEEHVAQIAQEIVELNADVINLVEVEGCDVLESLIRHIGSDHGYKGYLVEGTDTFTGQNVALLTRADPVVDLERTNARVNYPVANTTCTGPIVADDYALSKNYYTKIQVNDLQINLFSGHFLAYPDDPERCYKREAQAMVLQEYMAQQFDAGENTILFGDINDYDPDLQDANNDVPISNVLYFLKSGFTLTAYDNYLVNVGNSVPFQGQRYSCWYDRDDDCTNATDEFTAIDHTLIDPILYSQLMDAKYIHNYPASCGQAISDHYPVLVVLSV